MPEASEDSFHQDRYGFVDWTVLPQQGWDDYWDRIFVPDELKARLLNYARFTLERRKAFSIVGLPVHGIALLKGAPGTGKSSLVKGVAQKLAAGFGEGGLMFAEVNAHALPSQMLGDSQRNTLNLLERALPELAERGLPIVVLIDEVDSIATDRHWVNSGSDPIDVARATEAALRGLDHLAAAAHQMVVLATSNFPDAIDPAFTSRLDLTLDLQLPDETAIAAIVTDVLNEVGSELDSEAVSKVVAALSGLSGRDVRKTVFEALISRDASVPIDSPIRDDDIWAVIDSRRRDFGQGAKQ